MDSMFLNIPWNHLTRDLDDEVWKRRLSIEFSSHKLSNCSHKETYLCMKFLSEMSIEAAATLLYLLHYPFIAYILLNRTDWRKNVRLIRIAALFDYELIFKSLKYEESYIYEAQAMRGKIPFEYQNFERIRSILNSSTSSQYTQIIDMIKKICKGLLHNGDRDLFENFTLGIFEKPNSEVYLSVLRRAIKIGRIGVYPLLAPKLNTKRARIRIFTSIILSRVIGYEHLAKFCWNLCSLYSFHQTEKLYIYKCIQRSHHYGALFKKKMEIFMAKEMKNEFDGESFKTAYYGYKTIRKIESIEGYRKGVHLSLL